MLFRINFGHLLGLGRIFDRKQRLRNTIPCDVRILGNSNILQNTYNEFQTWQTRSGTDHNFAVAYL